MKNTKLCFYLFVLFMGIFQYSSPCLAGKEFTEEEFTTFTKKIEYRFENRILLSNALTHSSVLRQKTDIDEFQRLEHLGDKALNLAITDYLYETYPQKNEGYLAEESKKLISNEYVLKVAKQLDLLNDVMYEVDESSPNKGLDRISYTACEALIGAIYKDGGFNCANKFVRTHFILGGQKISADNKMTVNNSYRETYVNNKKEDIVILNQKPVIVINEKLVHPIGTLKEFRKLCEYKVLTPPTSYETTVNVEGKTFTGQGPSKNRAKRLAAKEAYEALTKNTVGKQKAIQALEEKFPQKVQYLPVTCNNNSEAEIQASYNGQSAIGKGDSLKKAKTEASKKLYELFKS